MIIRNGLVYTENQEFEKQDIFISNDTFTVAEMTQANTLDANEIFDASDCYVLPGLVDIHFHGCMGYDFCDGTIEALDTIVHYETTHGITSICPATMTLAEETLEKICKGVSSYINSLPFSPLVGMHLEGPFISPKKKGAQNEKCIIPANSEMIEKLDTLSGHLVKLITIAPEESGAMEFIQKNSKKYKISIGHTTADYETAMAAMNAGATHVTHLYNAMPPFTHRQPGVIGAAFDTANSEAELICDGVHINPSVVRASFQLFGAGRMILISDSMMATGMPDGEYTLGGLDVTVKGNTATLHDGTLAGSVTNLFDCMKQAMQMGIPAEQAILAATANPAKAIGLYDRIGSIHAGKEANLLIVDKNWNLKKVLCHGSWVL